MNLSNTSNLIKTEQSCIDTKLHHQAWSKGGSNEENKENTCSSSKVTRQSKKSAVNQKLKVKIRVKNFIPKTKPQISNSFIPKECYVKLKRHSIEDLLIMKVSLQKSKTRKRKNLSKYECSECEYITTENSNFHRHMRMHEGKKTYKCKKCSYSTYVKSNLDSHMATHKKNKPHKCDKCNFSTAHKSNLIRHMYIHLDVLPFTCDNCDFGTVNKTALKNHMKIHLKMCIYQCNKCSYGSQEKYKLERHQVIHNNSRDFKCSKCEYTSKRKDTLAKHTKRKHKN